MQFEVKNRFTGAVQFTAEIECDENAHVSVQLGLAVKWALKTGANLAGADLTGADLTGANLTGANLTGADLTRANLAGANLTHAYLAGADLTRANLTHAYLARADLAGANLTHANLRQFKADMWMTLTQNRAEVPALIAALRAGRVNGSQYEGECSCLVGTIAKAKSVSYEALDHNARNPAEQWFAPIRPGDTPDKETEGGFRARLALEWAEEWCALNGVEHAA